MKRHAIVKTAVVGVTCWAMLLPPSLLLAAGAERPKPWTAPPILGGDVVLAPGGVFQGQVIDTNGRPCEGLPVSLAQQSELTATTTTGTSGQFAIGGVRMGLSVVKAGQTQTIYRVWSRDTAPPSARDAAMVLTGPPAVRGQQGPIGYWLSNPFVIAGIAAAAVAIPVVLHNERADRVASP